MSGESSLTVRFGGDVAGLDSAVAVAKAQMQGFSAEVRKLSQEAARAGGVANENLTKALREAAASAAGAKRELESLKSAGSSIDQAAASVKGFHKNLDSLANFAWNNTSLSGNTIERVVNPIKGLSSAIGVVPTVAAAAGAAIAALALVTGNYAQNQLAELGKVAKETGLEANQIQGAKLVGASAGLDSDAMVAGLKNASQEFEQFKRNAGSVKDTLEKVDEEFLKVADKAKTSGEFIDLMVQEIRKLPREEGIDLAKAVFPDGTGEKLYGPIVRGEASTKQFAEAAKAAGVALDDGVVKAAAEAQRQIDEASAKASGKFLSALQSLAPPVAELKVQFYGVVGAIADATAATSKFVGELNKAIEDSKQLAKERDNHQTGGVPFKDAFAKQLRGYGVHPDYVEGPQQQTAGVSRARYEARDKDEDKGKKSKGDSDATNAARKDIDGQIEAVKQQTEINKQQYELDAANKKITEEQKKVLVQQADDQQLASIKALYEQEKQIAGQKPAQIAEINNKIEALESQHTLKMLQEQTKAAQESAKIGQQEASQMAGTLTSSLSTAIENGLDHVKTKDAGKKIAQSLRNELVNELAKDTLTKPLEAALAPAFKGIFSSITNPISSFLGGALGGGTDAAGGAALTGAATALTTAAAALSSAAAALGAGGVAAGAGGVAAGAGGVAAGAGGAAAGSGGFFSSLFSSLGSLLPAFDQGSFQLPSLGNFDGKGGFPALVHPDEMIVPAGPAGGLRQALKGGGAGAGAGGGGNTVHVAPTFNINATDSQDVHRMFMANQRQFGKAVSKMMRNGVMLGK